MAKAKAKDREPALFEETPAPQDDLEKKNQGVIKAREPTKKQRAALEAAPKGRAVVVAESAVVPLSDFQAMLSMLERLAVNPATNPEALGKFLDVQERLLDRRARDAFDEHLIALQEALPVFEKDGEVLAEGQARQSGRSYKAKFKFAKWETAKPRLTPVLKQHGFVLTHRTGTAPDGKIRVTAILRGWGYRDDSCYLDGEPDVTGAKNPVQARVSTVSYLKRHTAFAVLGIVAAGEDDDAKSAGKPVTAGEPVNQEQAGQLHDLIEAVGCGRDRFLEHMNKSKPRGHPDIAQVEHLPATRFDEAVRELRAADEVNREERAKAAGKEART